MIRTLNALLSFLAGIIGFGILFLFLVLITTKLDNLENNFFIISIPILFSPLYEELGKYLSILIWKIETFNSFFFGFSWGLTESVITYINRDIVLIYSIPIHIITSIILCYFIKKEKSILGLSIAITIHLGYNFLMVSI